MIDRDVLASMFEGLPARVQALLDQASTMDEELLESHVHTFAWLIHNARDVLAAHPDAAFVREGLRALQLLVQDDQLLGLPASFLDPDSVERLHDPAARA